MQVNATVFLVFICIKKDNSQNQSHYSYRFVSTMIEFAVKGRFTCRSESAFLHHTSRSRIVDEMSADERLDVGCMSNMRYHHPKSLRTDTFAPIWFAYPIAHRWFSFPSRKGAVARRAVAHGSYCLACLIPYDSPCGRIVKHVADYLQALLF